MRGPTVGKPGPTAASAHAGWRFAARRAAAFVVDVALLFAVLFPAGLGVMATLGLRPATGLEVWLVLLVNFSLPTWAYFALSDCSARGQTLGKRLFGLRVVAADGSRVRLWRALARTAAKLAPWELVHVSAFALADVPGGPLGTGQAAGLIAANGLAVMYLATLAYTGGRRSVHDFVAGTRAADVRGSVSGA